MRALTAILLFTSLSAHAYYTTMDTGEIIPKGHYRVLTEANIVFNDLTGLNAIGAFDAGFDEASNFRVILGGGAVGLQTGVYYKWVPIPDFENQPALGLMGGFLYARNGGTNYLNLRMHPLASKKFKVDFGELTPYVALPFGVTFTEAKTTFPLQLTLGSEWKPKWDSTTSFMAEFAINLHESYSYLGAAAVFRF